MIKTMEKKKIDDVFEDIVDIKTVQIKGEMLLLKQQGNL